MSRMKNSGIAAITEIKAKGEACSFVQKANFLVFGELYSPAVLAAGLTAKGRADTEFLLNTSVMELNGNDAHQYVDLLIAQLRFKQILTNWTQSKPNKPIDLSLGSDMVRFGAVQRELTRIFVGADPDDDQKWNENWVQKGWNKFAPVPHVCEFAITLGTAVLQATLAAVHPAWAAVLFFSRRTKFSHPSFDKDGFLTCRGLNEPIEPISDYGFFSSAEALTAGWPFSLFESHTEEELLTSRELQIRVERLIGKETDLKTIKEAADGLGVALAKAKRGG